MTSESSRWPLHPRCFGLRFTVEAMRCAGPESDSTALDDSVAGLDSCKKGPCSERHPEPARGDARAG